MTDTAFRPDIPEDSEQDQFGGPLPQGQSAPEEQSGPAFIEADEKAAVEKKEFNRVKMGGFLMELGLNILSSNRDDAGAAVGDAFGKTRSDRDTRKRTEAAESMAQSDRERKQRREDESDSLKQEKAGREKAAEKRAITKGERDKLTRIQKGDGSYEYVNIQKGIVFGEDKTTLIGKLTKDQDDRISANQRLTDDRNTRKELTAERRLIEEKIGMTFDDDIAGLGDNPSFKEIVNLAKVRLGLEGYKFQGTDPADEEPKNYSEVNWNE